MSKKNVNKTSEKEVYRLWWEYLKRSEKYKIFCDFMCQVKKTKLKKGNTLQSILPKELMIYISSKLDSRDFKDMLGNYEYFDDIFTNSFDEWWKTVKPSEQKLSVIVLNDPNSCKSLPLFDEKLRKQQKAKEKLLSAKETLNILTKAEDKFIFLAVPMVGGVTMEEISKQIADIRKKWAKEFDIEDYHFRRFNMPVSRVRYTELKRYLNIYDLKKQGFKMKEIVAKIDPNRKGDNANVLRSFHMDLQKAKRVIKNVEFGSFPELPLAGQEYQIIKTYRFPESHTDR